MINNPPLVYVDAQVFAYRLLPGYGASLKTQATKFFKDIEDGNYRGVVSSFTESEYRGIVKKVIPSVNGHTLTNEEETAAMKDFADFVQQMGIAYEDADTLAMTNTTVVGQTDIFQTAYSILINSHPFFNQFRNEWKAIGASDAILANLATIRGADFFATFDRGFKGLNHRTLQPLIIQEVY